MHDAVIPGSLDKDYVTVTPWSSYRNDQENATTKEIIAPTPNQLHGCVAI